MIIEPSRTVDDHHYINIQEKEEKRRTTHTVRNCHHISHTMSPENFREETIMEDVKIIMMMRALARREKN